MDFRAMAQAALAAAQTLQAEARSVMDDANLGDGEKRERVERINADILAKIDEARGLTEQGEREVEVRSLMERAGNLAKPAEKRNEAPSASDELRALARGEVREVTFRAATGIQTTDGTKGESNTIPTTFMDQVIVALREQSPIFRLARVITTNGGEPMEYPVLNSHYLQGAGPNNFKPGQANAFSHGEVGFDKVTLGANKYGALIEVSRELIEDSFIDFASIVAEDMGGELGRQVSTDAVAKLTGGNLTVGATVDAAAATPITGDTLMALYHSIVTGYRKNAGYVFNDATALKIRQVKDNYGQYLWQPGLQAGQPDVLLGRPVDTDYNVSVLPTTTSAAPGAVVGLYGDFSKFVIRQINGLKIVRSDEYGFDRDTVTFRATWRGDFAVVDGAALRTLNATHA